METRCRVRLLCRSLLIAVVSLGLTAEAIAGETGKIAGTVVDDEGSPLPGVQVIVEGTSPLRGTVTDEDGFYQIIKLDPDRYTVSFRFVGFSETRVENVQVKVDQTTRIDVTMRIALIEGEEVVIIAERPIVEMGRTTTTSVVDEQQLEALPVAGLEDAINLQAGVVDGHFRGGRTAEVSYLVNGVPITNVFSNTAAFEVQENAVANLEVISGVFNAEYGQALSGVVNIVTKSAPRKWSASVQADAGTYLSSRKAPHLNRTVNDRDTYSVADFETVMVPYTEAANLPNWQNYQFDIGGPLMRDRLGFRLTGRYRKRSSHMIGRDWFSPSDSSAIDVSFPADEWIIESSGTGDFVASESEHLFANPNLIWQVFQNVKLDYNGFLSLGEGRDIDHGHKYVPTGQNKSYEQNQTHILTARILYSNTAFSSFSYSFLHDKSDRYLYEIPDDFESTGILDRRYVSPEHNQLVGQNAFSIGGNDLSTWDALTVSHTFRADYTNQLTRVHQMKVGLQGRFHRLDNRIYGIEISSRTRWQPIVSPNKFNDERLRVTPTELSAYVQDKMEFENLIINAGLRADYFDADYSQPIDWSQASREIIADLSTPEPGDSTSNRVNTEPRFQLSPRLGGAFPISATGVVRFSAGLFFQIPALSLLYTNPEFEVDPTAGSNTYGNPGINPERTLAFEVGLQQALTSNMGVELTIFSKDIRNLTGQEFTTDRKYITPAIHWTNIDYGTIFGLTLSVFQRRRGSVAWDIDYTLQFADGTASDPGQAYGRFLSGLDPIRRMYRLDWDRRHVLNLQLIYNPSDRFSVSLINRLRAGAPYTSARDFVRSFVENNVDRPTQIISDVRMYWAPGFLPRNFQFFLQVENLFDQEIIDFVYADTGSPTTSYSRLLFERSGSEIGGVNTLDDWFYNAAFYGPPRQVRFGVRLKLQ